MTGGHVEFLNAVGGSSAINGGVIDYARLTGGTSLVLTGSDSQAINSTIRFTSEPGGSSVEIHGYNFRVYSGVQSKTSGSHNVVGYTLDGSFVYFDLTWYGQPSIHHFEIVTHPPTFRDPTGDWDFGIDDLNAIRNDFGNDDASADTNFDGVVNIADLNFVRNHFGDAHWLGPEYEFSGVIHNGPPLSGVPEPSTLWLTVLLALPPFGRWAMSRRS